VPSCSRGTLLRNDVVLKSVVFDLDGTLVDSAAVMREAMTLVCRELGTDVVPASEVLARMQGQPIEYIVAAAGLPPHAAGMFRRLSSERVASVRPFDDVIRVCARLKADRISLGILTGKDEARTLEILRHHGLHGLFDPIIASDSGLPPKPEPTALLEIIRVHGAHPSTACFVGDAMADLRTAQAAHVQFLRCDWSATSEPWPESSNVATVRHAAELEAALQTAEAR
jgi:phosphoglycolate phosphatase-like HAD superfamily hydrolase